MVTRAMETTINAPEQTRLAVQFKGKTFSLTVLQIYSNDLNVIEQQLQEIIAQAPKMFHFAPVAIDLELATKASIDVDLAALTKLLRQHKIVPVGITGGTAAQQQVAMKTGLAVLPASKNTKAAAPKASADAAPMAPTVAAPAGKTKVIHQPVRSGQQIYAKDADLIVLATVSHGAEIIADGNIHVYGSLHGRAIAGANGDLNARIFCYKLDAELVSIAGIYFLSDDYTNKKADAPMQIYLENNRLLIAEL